MRFSRPYTIPNIHTDGSDRPSWKPPVQSTCCVMYHFQASPISSQECRSADPRINRPPPTRGRKHGPLDSNIFTMSAPSYRVSKSPTSVVLVEKCSDCEQEAQKDKACFQVAMSKLQHTVKPRNNGLKVELPLPKLFLVSSSVRTG